MWRKIAIGGAALLAIGAVAVVVFVPQAKIGSSKAPDIKINLQGDAAPAVAGPYDLNLTNGALSDGFNGEILTLAARPILFVRGRANVADGTGDATLQAAYAKIRAFMAAHALVAAGPPIAMTEAFDQAANIWNFKAGIPLAAPPPAPPAPSDGIVLGSTFSGAAARFLHIGDPNQAQPTYAKIDQWLRDRSLSSSGSSWEEYTSDPAAPARSRRTNIYIPLG